MAIPPDNLLFGETDSMPMPDDRVYVVTDQGPATGIGTYADSVYRLLREELPIQVMYVGCSPLGTHPGWVPLPGARMAEWPFQVVPALRHNYRRLREVVTPDAAVHFGGVWYEFLREFRRSVVTLHDYYPRRPRLVDALRPGDFLRDASSLWQYVVLPRHVRTARARIVPTRHVQKCLSEGTSLSSQVIHHWVEPYRFHPREKDAARQTLGLPREGRLVLNVSGITSNKDYATLAAVAAGLPPGYRFVKVGGGLTHVPRVLSLPRLSYETYPLVFNACDVYVHTSVEEGFGRPLLEAMSSGLPIVSARTEVSEEVLGRGALMVSPSTGSAKEWVSKVEAVAQEDVRRRVLTLSESQLVQFSPTAAHSALISTYREVYGW